MINTSKLTQELEKAGISVSGCNSNGVVWDREGKEIQDREDVKRVTRQHDPSPAVDVLVSVNPEDALDEAVAEFKKGDDASLRFILFSLLTYLNHQKGGSK